MTEANVFSRFGRNKFQEAVKLVRKVDPKDIDWKAFRFMVFDIPNEPGSYEERYNKLGKWSPSLLYLLFITFLRKHIWYYTRRISSGVGAQDNMSRYSTFGRVFPGNNRRRRRGCRFEGPKGAIPTR